MSKFRRVAITTFLMMGHLSIAQARKLPIFVQPSSNETYDVDAIQERNQDQYIQIAGIVESLDLIDGSETSDRAHKILELEGGWTGNGGDGFACFGSKQISQSALDARGIIKSEYRNLIDIVVPRELTEHRASLWAPMKPSDNVLTYLKGVISDSPISESPYLERQLAYILDKMIDDIGTLNWNNKTGLTPLRDHEQVRPRTGLTNCVPVQLVRRYQKVTGSRLEVFFEYDQDLFRRMLNPVRSQNYRWDPETPLRAVAALVLHEAVYTLSSLNGDRTTKAAREFINLVQTGMGSEGKREWLEVSLSISGLRYYNALNVSSNQYAFSNSKETWLDLRRKVDRQDQDLKKIAQSGHAPRVNSSILQRLNSRERWMAYALEFEKNKRIKFSTDLFLLESEPQKLKLMKQEVCALIAIHYRYDNEVIKLCNY